MTSRKTVLAVTQMELLERIRADYLSHQLCFFLGAGASVASGLPIAHAVTREAVTALLDPSTDSAFMSVLQKSDLVFRALQPNVLDTLRLKVLLGAVDSRQISNRPANYYASGIAEWITRGQKTE